MKHAVSSLNAPARVTVQDVNVPKLILTVHHSVLASATLLQTQWNIQ